MRLRGVGALGTRARPSIGLALAIALVVSGAASVLALDGDASPGAASTLAPMPTAEPGLLVHDAWTRESPMVDLAAAVFMVIDNTTAVDDVLVRASSPAADVVELHQSAMADDGTMAMTPVEVIPIPAGGAAVLEPGGYHLMLIGLIEPLEAGGTIDVTLEFAQASPRTVSALVQPIGPLDAAVHADAMPTGSASPHDS